MGRQKNRWIDRQKERKMNGQEGHTESFMYVCIYRLVDRQMDSQ